ncbi:hypothetical protein Q7P35_012567 [Cladosporium inversicolor]
MRSLLIRGSPRTQNSHQPNVNLLTTPSNDPAQESITPSHDISPSPLHSNHSCDSDNGSSPSSLPHPHLSCSLEVLEAPINDHMDWTPPSLAIPTPETSDTSASSSDSDTPPPHQPPINLSSLLPLPTSSPGPLTHAHQQAMAHRITYDKLLPGGAFDPSLYTPVFLHDTLMLPGSLASLLGKVRYASITPSTPIKLMPHSNTNQPVVKRKLHNVVVEARTPIPADQRKSANEQWRLEARWVEAQVFVWRVGMEEGGATVEWELGEAISGAYEGDGGEMGVVSCWGGKESVVVGSSEGEGEWEVGDLTLDGKSEWAGEVVWGGRDVDGRVIEW